MSDDGWTNFGKRRERVAPADGIERRTEIEVEIESVPAELIRWARDNFLNDGAEGETVHRLCDELAAAHERIKALEDEARHGGGG